MATTTTNSPPGQLAASHNKMPTCVCVCVYLLYVVCMCRVFLCAPMHAHVLIFFSAVVTAWFTSASACNDVCHSSPSHLSTCCLCALFVVVHTFAHILLLLLPFFSSLCLYLPHRLHITLHKARITQATPFHLVSSSSSLPLLKIQSPLFSPSVCSTKSAFFYHNVVSSPNWHLAVFIHI